MATTTYVKRFGPALYGADGLAEADIRALPSNMPIKVTLTRARSLPQHRLYFAMLELVVDNLSIETTKDTLHGWVKLHCGVVELVPLKNGEVDQVPGSIAFDKMDQGEFNTFFERAAVLLCERIIPGLGKADLIRQAHEMLGWPYEAAA